MENVDAVVPGESWVGVEDLHTCTQTRTCTALNACCLRLLSNRTKLHKHSRGRPVWPYNSVQQTQRSTERAWHLTEDLVCLPNSTDKQLLWRYCVRQFVNRLPTTTHLSIRLHVRSASIIIFLAWSRTKGSRIKMLCGDSPHSNTNHKRLTFVIPFRRQEASCFLLSLWCQQLE